jgi:PAS domain S-box-containing protein
MNRKQSRSKAPSKAKPKLKTDTWAALRETAQQQLRKQSARLDGLSKQGIKQLVHELGTHQIELELQNEELRRARVELESSHARYADLYDFSPVGYFTLDQNGLMRELNLTGARMLGMEKPALLAKPFRNVVEPSDRAAFDEHLANVFAMQAKQTCELTIRKRDGSKSYARLHSLYFPLSGEGNGVCRTALTDDTELRQMEDALRRSETKFKTIFESSVDALGVSRNGRHVLVNPSYLSLFGYDRNDDLAGRPVLDFIAPGERKKIREYIRAREQGGSPPTEYETCGLKKDGTEFDIDVKVTAFALPPDTYTLVIIRDITERKKTEARLKQTSVALALVNKDLEAFSYAVSHDLKAPLRRIEGFTTAILEDHAVSLNEIAKDYFQRVVSASRRMFELINAMLSMSRLTRAELREKIVNLSALAEVAAYELKKTAPLRRVEFMIADGIKARGDISLLRSVLENLLNNAWKFSAKQPSATIEFGSTRMDGKDVYFVRDNGAGFHMEYADKLFMPFRRLHAESEFQGLGIGLATIHRIIQRHGGSIWAESDVGKGATFYFTLT